MLFALHTIAFVAVTVYALYLFVHVVYTRYVFVRLGKPGEPKTDLRRRLRDVLVYVAGQRKLFKDRKSGVMHAFLFYGFFILQAGLIELILKGFIRGYRYPLGPLENTFSLMQQWTVFLMLLAVFYAFYRRYVEKLRRLQWKRDVKAAVVYAALIVITASVFPILGFETIMLGENPDFAHAPFSGAVAAAFSGIGTQAATALFYLFWWIHMLAVLSFMVFVPQSKQAHEIFALFNVFLRKPGPKGRLPSIDFEDENAEQFGVGRIEDFSRPQLLNLYSCVECGRCTDMCPAAGTGKKLSPMHLMTNLRDHLTEKGAVVTSRTPWMPAFAFAGTRANRLALASRANARKASGDTVAVPESLELPKLIGDVVSEQEIWACTTCRNCEDACPVLNEHVGIIVDLRRHLVLTEGSMPAEMARTFQNIERQGNPWGISRNDRAKWREGIEDIAPLVHETEEFEYLFFVGSMGSYDNRNIKVARAVARLLHKAGVKFAVLGNEEQSSGDTARRAGNEYLFQQLAAENIETFKTYNVKKIVTACPHTYNTFKNEYPEFGLEAEVFHHTELLYQLIREGRLKPVRELRERVTYHDSCYLGRYNDIYDAPREILKAIPGVELAEMSRNREKSLCCGAGGGRMWLEEKEGTRINLARTEMALETKPSTICSACPYCLTMLSDGVKAKEMEDRVQTRDIAEILLQAVE